MWFEGFRRLVDQAPALTTQTDEQIGNLGKSFSIPRVFEPTLTCLSSISTAQAALSDQPMYEPITNNCQKFALSVMAGLRGDDPANISELMESQARSLEHFLRTLTIPNSNPQTNARRNSRSGKRRHLGPVESANIRLYLDKV